MIQERTIRYKVSPYEIIDEKTTEGRVYQLVRFSLSNISTTTRRRLIERILNETNAIGLIEWWMQGSIVKKPRGHFYGILIFKAT